MRILKPIVRAAGPMLDLVCPPGSWVEPDSGDLTPAFAGLNESARLRIARLATQNYCFHCGLSIGPHEHHESRDPCGRCGEREVGVVRIARVGTFSEPLVTLVHRLKFGRSWEVARVLAPFLYQAILQVSETSRVAVDGLLPVPLHWWRQWGRGFNQSRELAREVAALSGWRVLESLQRVRRTREQARIDAPTRRVENVHGAFRCALRYDLARKHLWLVDDVSTTGATLHAVATAIRKLPPAQRPASINAAVICVADHRSPDVATFSI